MPWAEIEAAFGILRDDAPWIHREGVLWHEPSQTDLLVEVSGEIEVNGREVDLTSGEFTLLETLVRHPNRVLSRDQLVDLIKGYDRSPFDRSIDVRVTRLRRKIEEDPSHPVFIRTVWGKGYLFTPQGDRQE